MAYPQTGTASTSYAIQAQAGQALEKVQPLLQEQIERLQSHAKDLDALTDRLHSLADRVCGSRPEGVANQASAPMPSHAIAQMNEIHSRIESVRERLHDAVQRLERL